MNELVTSALIRTQTHHQQICREAFQKLDLSEGQPKILLSLLRNDGQLQKDLSATCGVMPATMTSLLRVMVKHGLVTKKETRISGGKRGYLVYLTRSGTEAAKKTLDIMNRMEAICCDGFTEEEHRNLLDLLNRMDENLRRLPRITTPEFPIAPPSLSPENTPEKQG